jgi:hypothetical protein
VIHFSAFSDNFLHFCEFWEILLPISNLLAWPSWVKNYWAFFLMNRILGSSSHSTCSDIIGATNWSSDGDSSYCILFIKYNTSERGEKYNKIIQKIPMYNNQQ